MKMGTKRILIGKLVLTSALIIVLGTFASCNDKTRRDAVQSEGNINQSESAVSKVAIEPEGIAGNEIVESSSMQTAIEGDGPVLSVYYFHPTARCKTCLDIEAYSKESVDSWKKSFNGKVIWTALNIDEKENEQYLSRYDLKFSSLVISLTMDGKEIAWKNLENIWELVNDKNAFINYVTKELELFTNQK
jgi:hypothetical protein